MNVKYILKRIAEIPTKIQFQEWEKKLNHIGDLTTLKTTAKNNLVEAINEIMDSVFIGSTDAIKVNYDDSISSLGVANVQDAIFVLDRKTKELEKSILSIQTDIDGQANKLNALNSDLASQTGVPLNNDKQAIISSENKVVTANQNIVSPNTEKAITLNAVDIKYSDVNASLGATNVQKAIELLVEKTNLLESLVRATGDEVTTQTNRLIAINAELESLSQKNV